MFYNLFIFLLKKEGKDEWFDTHVSLVDCDDSIDFYSFIQGDIWWIVKYVLQMM
jgi:hypothetical protein